MRRIFPSASTSSAGFAAGAQAHITFGRNEPALGHYHRNIQQAVGVG